MHHYDTNGHNVGRVKFNVNTDYDNLYLSLKPTLLLFHLPYPTPHPIIFFAGFYANLRIEYWNDRGF